MVVLGKSGSQGSGSSGGGKNSPSALPPTDVLFVVEGTAMCGAYLNELRQTYIFPTLE